MIRTARIHHIALTVSDIARAEHFYTAMLGFSQRSTGDLAPDLAALLGADSGRETVLERGGQWLALQCFVPVGAAYPEGALACDQVFQHFALPTPDIAASVPEAAAPFSRGGPQRLPDSSGGATAYKFRDPDGHPLELIQFPDRHPGGIDHTAIVVEDAERSIAFYRGLGFTLVARQTNTGPEQDRLDGLDGAVVDVVALAPAQAMPHLELLAYRHPRPRAAARSRPIDLAATRIVLEVDGLDRAFALREDPDGHKLLLVGA